VRDALIRCVDWGCVRAGEEFAQRSLMMILNMLFLNIIQRSAKKLSTIFRTIRRGYSTLESVLLEDFWRTHSVDTTRVRIIYVIFISFGMKNINIKICVHTYEYKYMYKIKYRLFFVFAVVVGSRSR